jgi:hypothetical protein
MPEFLNRLSEARCYSLNNAAALFTKLRRVARQQNAGLQALKRSKKQTTTTEEELTNKDK